MFVGLLALMVAVAGINGARFAITGVADASVANTAATDARAIAASAAAPLVQPPAPVGPVPAPAPSPQGIVASAAVLWNAQRTPAPGPAQAIGEYAGGCLQGAVALPPSGPGYEVLHLKRNRRFGHPTLVNFVRALGVAARTRRLGLIVVGDLSQARGGPTPTGHRSHQSGLDVDIGYAAPARTRTGPFTPGERERLVPPAVVDLRNHKMLPLWGPHAVRLLAMAASDPAVDRIFVNPAIKRALCGEPARREPWFSRLRPWWGHHDHFHVRLKCPIDSPLCKAQDPTPAAADDGCGAGLSWWFSPDAQATQARRKQADADQGPVLPEACAALVAPGTAADSGVFRGTRQ
jgi:penicillin-insensitive murein DD-endopeptidase